MAGHSRPKDGVLSLAYVPAIPIHIARLCPPKRDHRDKPGDDSVSELRAYLNGLLRNGEPFSP